MNQENVAKINVVDVVFASGGRQYSFIADSDSYGVGDIVVVSVGKNNQETVGRIVTKKSLQKNELPLPLEKMKHVLRQANGQEKTDFDKAKTRRMKRPEEAQKVVKEEASYVSEGMQPDGSFIFSYEDYGGDSFDGMDIETTYILDAENTEKLRLYLSKKYVGSLESMLAQECGQDYRKKAAKELFEEAGIKYKSSCWIS